MASPHGDIDPTRKPSSDRPGVPPLADPQAPPPGSPRQPFEDLLNWAAELDAALSTNQPLDVTHAPATESLRELDEFAQTPVDAQPAVDIGALPTFTPLEEAEPALVWPEHTSPDAPAPSAPSTPPPVAAPPAAATPAAAATPPAAPPPVAPPPVPTAESTELERLVKELESDWFVPEPAAVPEPEPVAANGQATTGVVVDDSGELTAAVPEADAAAGTPDSAAESYWVPPSRRRFSGRTAGIAALIAVGAVIAIVVAVLALRSSDSGTTASPAARVAFDLPSFPIASSVEVDTEWALSGNKGRDFASTLTFQNRTSAPVRVEFQEVIPKSIASDADEITFVGPQPTIIKADPVVQYIVDIPGNSEVTRTLEVEVEPLGAERSRLEQWARDLENGSAQREGTLVPQTTTTSTTLPPETAPPETEPPTTRRGTTTTRRPVTPTTEEPPPPPPCDVDPNQPHCPPPPPPCDVDPNQPQCPTTTTTDTLPPATTAPSTTTTAP